MNIKRLEREVDKYIKNDKFFSHFPREFINSITQKIQLRNYDKNQIIYFPKEKITSIYIVHKGRIRITRVGEKGKVVTFRHVVTGDVFGDEIIIGKKIRDEYAEAIVKSTVWIIPVLEFLNMRENTLFASLYEKKLLERCREYEENLVDNIFSPSLKRVAKKLLMELNREKNTEKELFITHQELANMLGIRRETVTSCLKILEEEGFIIKRKGSIIIRNKIQLENWIEKYSV